MKKLLVIMFLLVSVGIWGQTPQPIMDGMRLQQIRDLDNQRNQNIIILMVNENQIRNFNQWRLWRRLKERKRERIVRRWQKEHGKNNIQPESLRRGHR